MNTIKCIFLLCFFQAGLAIASTPDPGSITLYGDTSSSCTLKIEEGQVDIQKEEKDCKDNSYAKRPSIELTNVRSAATITLSAPKSYNVPYFGCKNSDNYTVTLRTIKDAVSTKVDIWDLLEQDSNTVLVPGVRLIHKEFKYPFMTGIRCVRITFD